MAASGRNVESSTSRKSNAGSSSLAACGTKKIASTDGQMSIDSNSRRAPAFLRWARNARRTTVSKSRTNRTAVCSSPLPTRRISSSVGQYPPQRRGLDLVLLVRCLGFIDQSYLRRWGGRMAPAIRHKRENARDRCLPTLPISSESGLRWHKLVPFVGRTEERKNRPLLTPFGKMSWSK